eukprot:1006626-Rhodomonas_salina.1
MKSSAKPLSTTALGSVCFLADFFFGLDSGMAAQCIIGKKILNCTPASFCRRPGVSREIRPGRI